MAIAHFDDTASVEVFFDVAYLVAVFLSLLFVCWRFAAKPLLMVWARKTLPQDYVAVAAAFVFAFFAEGTQLGVRILLICSHWSDPSAISWSEQRLDTVGALTCALLTNVVYFFFLVSYHLRYSYQVDVQRKTALKLIEAQGKVVTAALQETMANTFEYEDTTTMLQQGTILALLFARLLICCTPSTGWGDPDGAITLNWPNVGEYVLLGLVTLMMAYLEYGYRVDNRLKSFWARRDLFLGAVFLFSTLEFFTAPTHPFASLFNIPKTAFEFCMLWILVRDVRGLHGTKSSPLTTSDESGFYRVVHASEEEGTASSKVKVDGIEAPRDFLMKSSDLSTTVMGGLTAGFALVIGLGLVWHYMNHWTDAKWVDWVAVAHDDESIGQHWKVDLVPSALVDVLMAVTLIPFVTLNTFKTKLSACAIFFAFVAIDVLCSFLIPGLLYLQTKVFKSCMFLDVEMFCGIVTLATLLKAWLLFRLERIGHKNLVTFSFLGLCVVVGAFIIIMSGDYHFLTRKQFSGLDCMSDDPEPVYRPVVY